MHRILAEAAATIAKTVFKEHKVLDHELARAFDENPRWGKRDRSFIAETVFEVVRWKRALAFVADSEETDAICAAQWRRMGFEVPEWWTHQGAPAAEMEKREADLRSQPRAVRESIPDWLDEWCESELGELWDQEIRALNRKPRVFLRVNTLKTTKQEAIEWLHGAGVQVEEVPDVPDALVLPEGKTLPRVLRIDGRVEIQDAGSQLIAPLLEAQPGERVIDACSGAGGKALHLASLMGNKGRVYAMDIDEQKLEELDRRAGRAGATCIQARLISDSTPDDFKEVADRLLIDAPCSGLGTLKRQPDLKWRIRPAQFERVHAIQKDLLLKYTKMLKPGGRLVYATCSVLPSENRDAVYHLLTHEGGYSLFDELEAAPSIFGFDGFYAAVVVKAL